MGCDNCFALLLVQINEETPTDHKSERAVIPLEGSVNSSGPELLSFIYAFHGSTITASI